MHVRTRGLTSGDCLPLPFAYTLTPTQALKLDNMTPGSQDLLPRVAQQSVVVVTSLLQSLVVAHHLMARTVLEEAVSWVCTYV
jgi:hypothetical protein